MLEVSGDIWDFHKKREYIIITTNGTVAQSGEAVMGRGIAEQAKDKFPKLAKEFGDKLIQTGNFPKIFPEYRLITFPVKHNWWEKADLKLIVYSAHLLSMAIGDPQTYWMTRDDILLVNAWSWDNCVNVDYLPKVISKIYMVRPGCSNGRRDWDTEVKPLISSILDDRFIVVQN